ncbi:MAG TPA: NAD(P)H-dependent oxidoreductase [Burkholderiaceae bacterium]|nr:NAD(P)H-dependent oxidoreductase [Burkholderiaceae bacterium]
MKSLLQIKSSIFSDQGQSSRLADRFVTAWRAANPGANVIVRDLAVEPVPHLDAARFGAFLSKGEGRSAEQQEVVDYSDALIAEVRNADVIVLGVPMYNFGVPSSLKAYFDHIARAGVTFNYTASGPQGLLTGKRVVVFATRGGQHAGKASDTQTGFIRTFLGFLGMTDVQFVYAEGLAISEAQRDAALGKAHESIEYLTEAATVAA